MREKSTISINEQSSGITKRKLNGATFKILAVFTIFSVLTAHFIWATIYYKVNTSKTLALNKTLSAGYGLWLIIYLIFVLCIGHVYVIKPYIIPFWVKRILIPVKSKIPFGAKYISLVLNFTILSGSLAFVIYDSWNEPQRLISLCGLLVFYAIGFAISANKSKINWNVVLWGITCQFPFALFTMRWEVGRDIFQVVGDKISIFLEYTYDASSFIYSDFLVKEEKVMAFQAFMVGIFLMFLTNILYYYGIMQKCVSAVGELLQSIIGSSICESVNAAANIFLGPSESPIVLKLYLDRLTDSELHCCMTSGFGTISVGSVPVFNSLGAKMVDLIASNVMSAPAVLSYSNLTYPEIGKVIVNYEELRIRDSEFKSVFDAAHKGIIVAAKILYGICSNIIAFLAFLNFINGVLSWYGELVGFVEPDSQWTIDLILAKIFTPISYLLGVPWKECGMVGEIIGLRTAVSTMVAFQRMGKMNLSSRSKTIATYAVSGYTNPSTIGITIALFGILLPHKRSTISRLVFKAFFSAILMSFTTACIAGALTSTVTE